MSSSSNSNRLQASNNIDRELKRQSNFDLSNLSEGIEAEIEKNRPWLTFKPDSKTVVKMDPNNGLKFESEESPFKNDKGETKKRYVFRNVETKEGWRKYMTVSRTGATQIADILKKGKQYIEVERIGSTKTNTRYSYRGVDSF